MSEPITEAELDVIKARAAEVFTGPRMAADREELLRAFGENVPRLTQEIRRLRAQLETEILRRDSLDETLTNAVADHKKDLTKLAAIRKAAAPVIKEMRDMDIEIVNKNERRYWFNSKSWIRENKVKEFFAAMKKLP